jgi:hypothetical protein
MNVMFVKETITLNRTDKEKLTPYNKLFCEKKFSRSRRKLAMKVDTGV